MTKKLTITALVVGAVGIGILWAAGVPFPFYPPPGILLLGAGAIFMSVSKARWAPAVGAALGLFVTVGFLASSTGIDNLTGVYGTAISVGTVVQVLGVATAFVAGAITTVRSYRDSRGQARAQREHHQLSA
jgi:hypothetical protein